jgi:hypothetical protein
LLAKIERDKAREVETETREPEAATEETKVSAFETAKMQVALDQK